MTNDPRPPELTLTVDGQSVAVPDDGASLLEVLRDRLGVRSVKDGCSPQGQCGCCTVLVDGSPRVSCVTPARRVRGREVTTLAGLDAERRDRWADAFCATGGSQCGFCTPGILIRLDALSEKAGDEGADRDQVDRALAAHLCRCTGWQTIRETWSRFHGGPVPEPERDLEAASERAGIESGGPQIVSPAVALGQGGFADDGAPLDALVAVLDPAGDWVVADTLHAARLLSGKVQGRRTTDDPSLPVAVPDGSWALTLRTSWVEPAYLETDASWCEPGGEPVSPLANGGAFGAKTMSDLGNVARRLADEHGRPVRVLLSREDTVRLGAKRPPIGAGVRVDGSGIVRVVRTKGLAELLSAVAPELVVEEVDVSGPPTSAAIRAAGWAEVAMLRAGLAGEPLPVVGPGGARAEARFTDAGIELSVSCGRPLDEVVLRSYCIGAAHMAYGWVTSESLTVGPDGIPLDLTVRSFGIVRPAEMPEVTVVIEPSDDDPVPGSDAVFAAVAAATWLQVGTPADLPAGRPT